MIFDAEKMANGIGKAIGEGGKISSEELTKNIRRSIDAAVGEINSNVNHGIAQMRSAHENLKIYVSQLEEKANELKGDFENLRAENTKFVKGKITEVTSELNEIKADLISQTNQVASDIESRIKSGLDDAKEMAENAIKESEEKLKAFQDEMRRKLETDSKKFIDELIDGNIVKHGDRIADVIIRKLIPAFFRMVFKHGRT